MSTAFEDAFKSAGFGPHAIQFLTAYARLLNNGGSRRQADDLLDYADRQSLPGEGQRSHAGDGLGTIAPSRHPNGEAGGHGRTVREGHTLGAPASPPSGDGEGHCIRADEGQSPCVPSSPPVGGGGGQEVVANEGRPSNASPPSRQRAGHMGTAGKANGDLPASGAGAGHRHGADKAISAMPAPRPQSASDRAAAKAILAAHGMRNIFDTVVGGTGMKLGDFTRYRLKQEKRRLVRDTCLVDLMLDGLDWPDEDQTRIRDFASVAQLEKLYQKSFKALEAMDAA